MEMFADDRGRCFSYIDALELRQRLVDCPFPHGCDESRNVGFGDELVNVVGNLPFSDGLC